MCKIENYMLSLPPCLVPLKRNGLHENFRVSISPLLVANMLSFLMLCVVFCGVLMFVMAIGKAEECHASCQVTKAEFH